MANPRKVIYIKERRGRYVIGQCEITLCWNPNEREFLHWVSGLDGIRRIIPHYQNPIGGHFLAMEKGHSYNEPDFIPRLIIAHTEQELQEKMYAQAVRVANMISSKCSSHLDKWPVEDSTKTQRGNLEEALENISF